MAKFSVGDKVVLGGLPGVVTEVSDDVEAGRLYGVKVDGGFESAGGRFQCKATGEVRDHQFDTIGCVAESDLSGSAPVSSKKEKK